MARVGLTVDPVPDKLPVRISAIDDPGGRIRVAVVLLLGISNAQNGDVL